MPLTAGAGSLTIPIAPVPAIVGFSLSSQCFVPDLTSPADLPLSHSFVLVSEIGG